MNFAMSCVGTAGVVSCTCVTEILQLVCCTCSLCAGDVQWCTVQYYDVTHFHVLRTEPEGRLSLSHISDPSIFDGCFDRPFDE